MALRAPAVPKSAEMFQRLEIAMYERAKETLRAGESCDIQGNPRIEA